MRGIIVKVVVNAIAIWVASALIPAVGVTATGTVRTVVSYLVVGALIGLVNAFIKPVVTFFAFPFIILSLGLMVFVVNAFMLKLVDWLSHALGIAFDSGPFFWSTLGAAVIVSIVSMILHVALPDD